MLTTFQCFLLLVLFGPTGFFLMMSLGVAVASRAKKDECYPWDAVHDE